MPKVVIDPVTRIEGHLRVTTTVEGGKVTDAWNTNAMFRGFEIFMKDRDPLSAWQFAQRICGVCPTPHGEASIRATEAAFGIKEIPDNARLLRNMMEACQLGYDHILWFYQLNAFDYVNVPNGLEAKPTLPTLKAVQDQVRRVVESGQLGPFSNHWWDHPGYKLTPEQNLELTAHYLQSLDIQQRANDAAAILGGRYPMVHNYIAGGMTKLPDIDKILYYRGRMQEVKAFVDDVMMQDLLMVAPAYIDHATFGKGVGNYLSWGLFDEKSQDAADRVIAPGAIVGSDLTQVQDVSPNEAKLFTKYSWFDDDLGEGKHPLEVGQERIDFTELPPIEGEETPKGKYDWAQAARYGDDALPMEVGPLAEMLISYVSGREQVKQVVDATLAAIGQAGKPQVLQSALGRIAARVLKAKVNADNALRWSDELLENIKAGDTKVFETREVPDEGEGFGALDAPRGALSHYMRIRGGKIERYAAVPASNWNISPRDDKGVRGPLEEALVGTPVADPTKPLEILRVIHTFDP